MSEAKKRKVDALDLQKDIKELLLHIKSGDLFKVSDFKSVDDARRFIDEYMAKLPAHSKEDIEAKQKEITEAEKNAEQKTGVYDKADWLSFGVSRLDEACSYFIPSLVSGYKGYDFKLVQDHNIAGYRADSLPPKEVAEVCYGFVQDLIKTALETPKEENPIGRVLKLKTPYEKLPLATRAKYWLDNKLHLTPDPKVDLLAKCHGATYLLRDELFTSETVFNQGREYLTNLVNKPVMEMVETLKNDNAPLKETADLAKADKEMAFGKVEQLKAELTGITNAVAIEEAMNRKVDNYIKTHDPVKQYKARVSLAHKGLMSNDKLNGERIDGSVAADRMAKAKLEGKEITVEEAYRHKQKTRV